jgi:biopolymer transport protein ExbB/TolQ
MMFGFGLRSLLLNPYTLGFAALAIVGIVVWGLVWHAGKVRAVYESGVQAERIQWEETRRRFEAQRATERREAAEELDRIARELASTEDEADSREAEMQAELERALAAASAGLKTCSIPADVLAPHRSFR